MWLPPSPFGEYLPGIVPFPTRVTPSDVQTRVGRLVFYLGKTPRPESGHETESWTVFEQMFPRGRMSTGSCPR